MDKIVLDDTEFSYTVHTSGSVSIIPGEDKDDVIARLHAVVKEITGKDVDTVHKPRIGFLP